MAHDKKEFCKIFIHDNLGQVVVMKSERGESKPCISIKIYLSHLSGYAEAFICFSDNEEGEKARDEQFYLFDKHKALAWAEYIDTESNYF